MRLLVLVGLSLIFSSFKTITSEDIPIKYKSLIGKNVWQLANREDLVASTNLYLKDENNAKAIKEYLKKNNLDNFCLYVWNDDQNICLKPKKKGSLCNVNGTANLNFKFLMRWFIIYDCSTGEIIMINGPW